MSSSFAIVLGATSTQRAIGWILASLVVVGLLGYFLFNLRTGNKEIGSEIELAPNRKPYYDDEILEGRKLDLSLSFALVLLTFTAVALPIYWLAEPGRMAGAEEGLDRTLTNRGTDLYDENCANCHGPGATGGSTAVTLTDENGDFVAQVTWAAPSLTTVLSRFDEDEVRHILNFGRNGVMPAWGAPGGGPMTTQQIDELIYYMRSVQLTPEEASKEVEDGIRAGVRQELIDTGEVSADAPAEEIDAAVDEMFTRISDIDASEEDKILYGRLIFDNASGAGAFNCARCHTPGFSYGATSEVTTEELLEENPALAETGILTGYSPGGGYFGWNLTGGSTVRQFPSTADHADFISAGSENGVQYGQAGQGSGQMPGFGGRTDDDLGVEWTALLAPEQIEAVVAYERSL